MNTRDFGTELFRTLIAVVEEEGYTKAALRLGMSQPAVSSHIKRLTENLGVELFDKRSPGVRLTASGRSALDYARKILYLHDNLLSDMAESGSAVSRLRIGASSVLAHSAIMQALAEFRARHPDIRLEFHREMSTRQIMLLNAGQLDICLALTWHDPRNEAFMYWRAPVVWLAPKDWPLPVKPPVNIVAHGASMRDPDTIMAVLRDAGVDYRLVLRTNDVDTSVQASRAGLGVTIIMLSRSMPDFMQVLGEGSGLPPLGFCYLGVYLNPDTRTAQTEEIGRLIARTLAHEGAEVMER